jgi:hypothetical protein
LSPRRDHFPDRVPARGAKCELHYAASRTIVVVQGAPKRPVATPNRLRLAYFGPAIAIDTDAARAAMIVERIRSRCPELTRADLLLVARVLADAQRVKKAAAKRAAPAKKRA